MTVSVGAHKIEVLAAFGEAESLESVGLAGQEGFFDRFRLLFDRSAAIFELEPC